jgi:glyoxylase-like metal-dependent hydrolase (beta-lactamase superfamily II)
MDSVPIREEQAKDLDYIAHGVRGLRIIFVNVFSVADPDGSWTLIDAGLPFSALLIRKWAEDHFSSPPKAIVLTHGHFDHVGSAGTLADEWNVPVYANPREFPYLTEQKEYPKPNAGAGGGLMSLLSPVYPRSPVNLGTRLRALPEADGVVPILPEWELLHTPGHTPGHVSFFRPEDRTLLVGDAFCTTKPESFFEAALAQVPELHGPPSYFTSDWQQARQSVQKLSGINALTVAPGHGKPVSGVNVPNALQALSAEFDRVAVPDNQKWSA